jgi:hypothetical protein
MTRPVWPVLPPQLDLERINKNSTTFLSIFTNEKNHGCATSEWRTSWSSSPLISLSTLVTTVLLYKFPCIYLQKHGLDLTTSVQNIVTWASQMKRCFQTDKVGSCADLHSTATYEDFLFVVVFQANK